MSGELGRASYALDADLEPLRRNVRQSRAEVNDFEHVLDSLSAIADIAAEQLKQVKITPRQGEESRGSASSIIEGVRGIRDESIEAARELDRVKISESQATESVVAGERIKRNLNDIGDEADRTNRKMDKLGRNPGAGIGPFGSGFGRIGVLGAAIGAGTVLGPAAGPGVLGLLAAIPMLATTGAGAVGALALAFAGVGKAIGGDKKAFDDLGPSAQAFVQTVRSLSGWFDKLKETAASNMFPGLTDALHSALSPGTVSAVTKAVSEFARAIGDAGAAWGRYFGSSEFQSIFGPLMQAGARNLGLMSDAALHLFDAMGVLARAAIPLTTWMVQGIDAGSRWAAAFLHAKDATGALGGAMNEAQTSLRLVGNLIAALLRAVGSLGDALYPVSKVAVKDLTDGLNALAGLISRNKDGIREFVNGALEALVSTVKTAAPIVGKLAHGIGDVVDAIGGWKTAFEIVLTGVLVAKLAGVASALGDIRLGMLNIAKLGPIPVIIALSMVRKNDVGQAELDRLGLGFLGNLPIVGNAGTQITAGTAALTQSAILGAGHALGIGTQNGMTPAEIVAAAARSGKIDMTTGLPLPGKGPGPIPISGPTGGVKSSLLANVAAAAASVGAESIVITSGARSKSHNAAVGGVSKSNHLTGDALDGYAIIGGQKVPLGTALKSVAAKYGIRSGDVAGFFNGNPDPVHVDDAANQGGSVWGSDPAFTKNLGAKPPKPPVIPNLVTDLLNKASANASKSKQLGNVGGTAKRYLENELGELTEADKALHKLVPKTARDKQQISAKETEVENKIRDVHTLIKNAIFATGDAILPDSLKAKLTALTVKFKADSTYAAVLTGKAAEAYAATLRDDITGQESVLTDEISVLKSKLANATGKQKAAIQKELTKVTGQLQSVQEQVVQTLQGAVQTLQQHVATQFAKVQGQLFTELGKKFFQNGLLTPLEQQLADMQSADTATGLTDSLASAKAQLAADIAAAADAVTITADKAAIDQANRAIAENNLAIAAAAQRKQADTDYAAASLALQDKLDVLADAFQNGTGTIADLTSVAAEFGLTLDAANIPSLESLSLETDNLVAAFKTLADYIATITGTRPDTGGGSTTPGVNQFGSIDPAIATRLGMASVPAPDALARFLASRAIPMAAGGIGRAKMPTLFYSGGDEDFAFSGEGSSFAGIGGGIRTVEVPVYLNDREVARLVADAFGTDGQAGRVAAQNIDPHLSKVVKV